MAGKSDSLLVEGIPVRPGTRRSHRLGNVHRFVVYKPELLVKLRSAAGSNIGVDLDPSHLIWPAIDPALAVEQLAGAIDHIHMKDVQINPLAKARNGVIDAKPFGNEINRP